MFYTLSFFVFKKFDGQTEICVNNQFWQFDIKVAYSFFVTSVGEIDSRLGIADIYIDKQ